MIKKNSKIYGLVKRVFRFDPVNCHGFVKVIIKEVFSMKTSDFKKVILYLGDHWQELEKDPQLYESCVEND